MRKVEFNLDGECGVMNFPSGKQVLFDKEDYRKLSKYPRWEINDDGEGFIRVRAIYTNAEGKKCYDTLSSVLGYPRLLTSPKNGNHLDMRKDNLEVRTRQQVRYNSKLGKNNTSGVKGVSKNGDRWKASIGYLGDTYNLGTYNTKNEAVRARLVAEDIYCRGHMNATQRYLHKALLG